MKSEDIEKNDVKSEEVETKEKQQGEITTEKTKKKFWLIPVVIVAILLIGIVGILLKMNKNATSKNLEEDILMFEQGLIGVKVGDKWGYVNKKSEIIINPQYDNALSFSENGLARVKQGEKWG